MGNVIIKTSAGNKVTVTLDDSTRVAATKGKVFMRRSEMSVTALVPGLPVEVKAEGCVTQPVRQSASNQQRMDCKHTSRLLI